MIDGDDVLHKDYLKILYNTKQKYGVSVVCGVAKNFMGTLPDSKDAKGDVKIFKGRFDLEKIPCIVFLMLIDAAIFLNTKYGSVRFPETIRYGEDVCFTTEIYMRTHSVALNSEAVYFYRFYPHSSVSSIDVTTRCCHEAAVYEYLSKKYSSADKNAKRLIKQRKTMMLYGYTAYKQLNVILFRNFSFPSAEEKKFILKYMRKDLLRVIFKVRMSLKSKLIYVIVALVPNMYFRLMGKRYNLKSKETHE